MDTSLKTNMTLQMLLISKYAKKLTTPKQDKVQRLVSKSFTTTSTALATIMKHTHILNHNN